MSQVGKAQLNMNSLLQGWQYRTWQFAQHGHSFTPFLQAFDLLLQLKAMHTARPLSDTMVHMDHARTLPFLLQG